MTDEGFTLENIFIDGIGNQISNITLNSHNEMNALTKKKKIGLNQNSRIKTIKRTKKLSLKHNKNLLSQFLTILQKTILRKYFIMFLHNIIILYFIIMYSINSKKV